MMNYRKQVLLPFLIFAFLFIPTQLARADCTWLRNLRITITLQRPVSYQGTNAEFLANPTYVQGEQTTFNITFTYEVRWGWVRFRMPVYIPRECIRATFPNLDTRVTLNHLFWGYYTYTSPVLTQVGNNNHTLSITVFYTLRFSIFGRTYRIPIPMAIAQKTISVTQRPLNIEITSPIEGAIHNTNPLPVFGTIDDNNAEVTVDDTPAIVRDNRFSAEIPVVEGENIITARAENEFGTTDTDSVTVTIDTTPPQIEITSPEEGYVAEEEQITILGTYTEANLERITVNGMEASFRDGSFSVLDVPLPDIGDNTITAIATDRVGYTSEDSVVVIRELSEEEVVENLYNKFNLVEDMTADMTVSSTLDGRVIGETVYTKYYYKRVNKTKTEFYETVLRENLTEIVITDGPTMYFISPVTRHIDQTNLAENAGITNEQFRQMDITSNLEGFVENHNLTIIEAESNREEGIYAIEAVPNTPNNLYSRLKLWIDYNRGLLVKSELYRGANLIETTEILESEEIAPGIWVQTRMGKFSELESGEFITTMEYSNIRINEGLDDLIFGPESL